MGVERSELANVPYLNVDAVVGNEPVSLQPMWDGAQWRTWLPAGTQLQEIPGAELQQGRYYSQSPADPDADYRFAFIEMITKRAHFRDVAPIAKAIENDLCNISASLWKLDHFFSIPDEPIAGPQFLVVTELEYLLVVCRSLFDLLQVVATKLWARATFSDCGKPPKALPEGSFAKMALHGSEPRKTEELIDKYGLPASIAEFYQSSARVFVTLRSARDGTVHHGKALDLVFRTERGFAVRALDPLFSALGEWDKGQLTLQGLGSVNCLAANIAHRAISVCDKFAEAWPETIVLHQDIAPGYSVFLRGIYVKTLGRVDLVRSDPWARLAA